MGSLGAIRRQLRNAQPAFRDVLFGFGWSCPIRTFTATGAEIIPEVLLDRRCFRRSLKQYVNSLAKYWKADYLRKRGCHPKGLGTAELREARQILRPDFETALSLGGYLTGWTTIWCSSPTSRSVHHEEWLPTTHGRPRRSGTGKSVIALDRARQYCAEGRQVLYLCFNRLLAAHVRTGLKRTQNSASMQVHSVHALYHKLIEDARFLPRLQAHDQQASDFFSERFPELAAEALCEGSHAGWDVLVVDEAQDLLTPEHLDVFDLLLKEGMGRGYWHLFFDPQQNIYGEDIQSTVRDRDRRVCAGIRRSVRELSQYAPSGCPNIDHFRD